MQHGGMVRKEKEGDDGERSRATNLEAAWSAYYRGEQGDKSGSRMVRLLPRRRRRDRSGHMGTPPLTWQAPPSDARPRQRLMLPPPPPRRPVLTVLTPPRAASGVACKPKVMDVCWAAWGDR
jgi:hypothetical protein